MSVYLDIVSVDREPRTLEHPENTVRVIREILPFVLGKYGLARSDCLVAAAQELPHRFDYSI